MLAFLHLYLLATGHELFVKGNVGNSLRATLAYDLKRIESPRDDVSGTIDASFKDSDGSLDWTFDETL